MARFLSACDLCSLVMCLWSDLFGIDGIDEPIELWRGCCCCVCCCCCCDDCWRIDCILGIPPLELLLFRLGIGPFVLLLEDRCSAPAVNCRSARSDGTFRSFRSFLCCRFEPDPDAVLIDDDDVEDEC